MYISDYGYATSNSNWTKNVGSDSSTVNSNWMYMGISEWTISPWSSYSTDVLIVHSSGVISITELIRAAGAVRPVFYLTSSTTYVSGSGTQSDPIRIN